MAASRSEEILDQRQSSPLIQLGRIASGLDAESASAFAQARGSASPADRPACRRGCAACCHQMIPLTTLEAQRIAEHLSALPRAERRDIGKGIARQLQRFTTWAKSRPAGGIQDRAVNVDYLRQRIPCPFLGAKNECRIYPVRPLICRGHHALGTNENCQTGEHPIRSIPSLDRATTVAAELARQLTTQLAAATQGGLISSFAPLFHAALTSKSPGPGRP